MATTNTAKTHWEGSLKEGKGKTELATSGVDTFDVKWSARENAGKGTTNPEELIGAALSTCYCMALSNKLSGEGHEPASLDAQAEVTFQPGEGITKIALTVSGDVPGLSADEFKQAAEWAKDNCPVSQALKAVTKTLVVK